MAEQILGVDFEIHGGGSDLIFPHHENEIAQTEAARGEPLARLWMHNGMVEMGDEKMAKSVGNIRLLHGALEQFGREALLMWMVGAHYRKPVAYTEDTLEDAARAVDRVRELVRRLDPEAAGPAGAGRARGALLRPPGRRLQHRRRRARSCSPGWPRPTAAWTPASASGPGALGEMLHAFGLESLLERRRRAAARRASSGWPPSAQEARAARDFERADRLRDELAEHGWEIRDTADGARGSCAT